MPVYEVVLGDFKIEENTLVLSSNCCTLEHQISNISTGQTLLDLSLNDKTIQVVDALKPKIISFEVTTLITYSLLNEILPLLTGNTITLKCGKESTTIIDNKDQPDI